MTPLPHRPWGSPAADHLGPQLAVGRPHMGDGPGPALHAHGEPGALEGGAGGGGGGGELPFMPQGDLPVGADVRQELGALPLTQGGSQQGGGHVAPHKGGDAGGEDHLGLGAGQPQGGGGEDLSEQAGGGKGGRGREAPGLSPSAG